MPGERPRTIFDDVRDSWPLIKMMCLVIIFMLLLPVIELIAGVHRRVSRVF